MSILTRPWQGFQSGKQGYSSGLAWMPGDMIDKYTKTYQRTGSYGMALESARRQAGRGWNQSWKTAWEMSFKGQLMVNMPLAAFSVATAPRGHEVSAGVSAAVSGIGAMAGGLMFGTPGAIAGSFLFDAVIGDALGRTVQNLKDSGTNARRLNMGGDYVDYDVAYTQRQAAAAEMGRSLLNARQWLGNESTMMHS